MTYPYTYLIVTNDRYCGLPTTEETEGIPSACGPLSNWRTELGVPATLRTVEWIKENYWDGETEDLQKAIRDFITDAWKYWGTQLLIIIGDIDLTKAFPSEFHVKYSHGYIGIVPVRFLCSDNFGFVEDGIIRSKIVPYIGNQDYCPCDLYYMDVTDNFDKDGDDFYGEPDHDIYNQGFKFDINVYGGRVPADKVDEVENFINKLLHYEKLDFVIPPTGTYLSKCLQIGSDFGYYDLSDLQNNGYLPNFYNNINNIFEGFENNPQPYTRYPDYPEPWQVVEEMNENTSGIINFGVHGRHDGYLILTHKSEEIWPLGTIQWLSTRHKYTNFFVHSWNYDKALEDVDVSPKYSFIYSDACSSNHYDDNKEGIVGEEVLFNQTWGGPNIIGNIRLGWGGDSYDFMSKFYEFLMNKTTEYSDDECYCGVAQCKTLKFYWPSNYYSRRNTVYVNQLFGCPRTSIWRGDPEIFDVSTQVIQNLDNTYTLRVTVLNSDTSNSVENSSVCLWMRNELPPKYFVKLTNSSGIVEFNVGSGCSNATLTTSYEKYNYKPYQTTITIP
ncbi:MAG: C25 family cysteine peptidase [bacterium]